MATSRLRGDEPFAFPSPVVAPLCRLELSFFSFSAGGGAEDGIDRGDLETEGCNTPLE